MLFVGSSLYYKLALLVAVIALLRVRTADSSTCNIVSGCSHLQSPPTQPIARYTIVADATGQEPVAETNICLTTDSSSYPNDAVVAIVIRSLKELTDTGTLCSDRVFDEKLVCTQSTSGAELVLLVSLSAMAGEIGESTVSYVIGGIQKTKITLNYAPEGIHLLHSSSSAGGSIVSWSIRGVKGPFEVVGPRFSDDDEVQYHTIQCHQADRDSDTQPVVVVTATYSTPHTETNSDHYLLSIAKDNVPSQTPIKNKRSQSGQDQTGSPVLVTNTDKIRYAEVNTTHIIECEVQGSSATPVWYFNNIPITSAPPYNIKQTKLTILSVSSELCGWYTCTASNQFGKQEVDFLVVVAERPRILVGPVSYVYQMNSQVVLPCSASGFPPPAITWFENDQRVTSGENGLMVSPTTGALTIASASTDTKQYRCTAGNLINTAISESAGLTFHNTTTANTISIQQDVQSEYTLTKAEDSVVLNCTQLLSKPSSSYKWYKDHVLLVRETNSQLEVVFTSNGSSWGHYCCVLILSSEIADRRCYMVATIVEPVIQPKRAMNVSIPAGRSINLLFTATTANSLDLPTLSLSKNGVSLPASDSTGRRVVSSKGLGYLQLESASTQNSGLFKSTGRNSAGTVKAEADIRVIETCTNNAIRSPGAEEDDSVIASDWSIDFSIQQNPIPGNIFSTESGERVFALDNNVISIQQRVAIPPNITAIHLSGRMRAALPPRVPLIHLNISDTLSTLIRLPFPSSSAWQWIEEKFTVNITEPNNVRVSLLPSSNGLTSVPNTVFFDDLCLSFLTDELATPSSSPTLSTSTPEADNSIPFIVTGVLLVVIVATVLIVIIVVLCVCCRKKYRRLRRSILLANISSASVTSSNETGTFNATESLPNNYLQIIEGRSIKTKDSAVTSYATATPYAVIDKKKRDMTLSHPYTVIRTSAKKPSQQVVSSAPTLTSGPVPVPATDSQYMELVRSRLDESHTYESTCSTSPTASGKKLPAMQQQEEELYEYVDIDQERQNGRMATSVPGPPKMTFLANEDHEYY